MNERNKLEIIHNYARNSLQPDIEEETSTCIHTRYTRIHMYVCIKETQEF